MNKKMMEQIYLSSVRLRRNLWLISSHY